MSDQNVGKRMVEEHEMMFFIDAYEHVTGERLEIISQPDPPDFVCQRPDGSRIEVELTRVENQLTRDARVLNPFQRMPPDLTVDVVLERIEAKAAAKPDLLVLQLLDGPVEDLVPSIDAALSAEGLADYGFSEIWLADYTELDSHGDIALFGLYPERWWGLHERSVAGQKPYG